MNMNKRDIISGVERYYTDKVVEKGATPQGVDWNSEESQNTRFAELLKIVEDESEGSLLDFGCGYAGLLHYMSENGIHLQYAGMDISEAMLEEARKQHPSLPDSALTSDPNLLGTYDYVVASGIFNVRLRTSEDEWKRYVLDTLHCLSRHSVKGFAFNVLTSYSDPEYMREDLFYADPCFFFDHCKTHYSEWVALLHDYGLYEFTLLVRKQEDESWLT